MRPLIYCNIGKRVWTEYSIKSAQKANPNIEIHVITDNDECYNGCHMHNMKDYCDGADRLRKVYTHMSTNPEWFEFACLQRWPVVLDFVTKNNIDKFIVTDWDVFFTADPTKYSDLYSEYDFTYQNGTSIGLSVWNTRQPLNRLCDIIYGAYSKEDSNIYGHTRDVWRGFVERKIEGGISDMFFAKYLINSGEYKCYDTYQPQEIEGGIVCWDNNMSLVAGGWEADNNTKKITVSDGQYYCNHEKAGKVKMVCLHFAGHSREMMVGYYGAITG